MADVIDPSVTSADYNAMSEAWTMIGDIRAGSRAIKSRSTTYLPAYEKESTESYNQRLAAAPWRPEFTDALQSLCAKPFSKEVALQGEVPDAIKVVSEDVDGRGNNLHVFARQSFTDAVAHGLDAIYVTFPAAEPARTRAEERASGVRPYWVHITAPNILALYTKNVGGQEVVEHIRFREDVLVRDGFTEREIKRIRILELDETGKPTSQLWERAGTATSYVLKEGPVVLAGVKEVPVVLFFTGQRSGNYRVKPPLLDLAVMQIEIYQALSRKDQILTYAGAPMLKGKGFAQPVEMVNGKEVPKQIVVGPKSILWAPPSGDGVQPDWDFVQPNAANIKEIRDDLDSLVADFRRLAMQPTTAKSGVLSATGEAVQGAKAHSAVEAWANDLKDTLEQAFVYTAQWMNAPDTTEVFVHTDFGVDIDGAQDADTLLKARMAGEISRRTYWDEMRRRGKLGPQFDPDDEEERLSEDAVDRPIPRGVGADRAAA